MKKVIKLQNGSSLNEKQFVKYFESKVLYTIRKFNLFKDIEQRPQVHELLVLEKIGNKKLSKECLDDISVLILQAMMKNKGKESLSSLLPKHKNIIRPFYFMSKEEMILYSKIKKINFVYKFDNTQNHSTSSQNTKNKTHKKNRTLTHNIQTSELNSFLNELEKQQRNVKNSIVCSLLKIEHLI